MGSATARLTPPPSFEVESADSVSDALARLLRAFGAGYPAALRADMDLMLESFSGGSGASSPGPSRGRKTTASQIGTANSSKPNRKKARAPRAASY